MGKTGQMIPPSLRNRVLEPELMDDPDLDPEIHRQALAGLARINRFARTTKFMVNQIRSLADSQGDELGRTPIRILDIASGGGDVACAIARSLGKRAVLEGWDISPTAIAVASARAAQLKLTNVQFHQRNILAGSTSDTAAPFDIVVCTLFLHHLDQNEAIKLFQRMHALANRVVLIDDLRRTSFGLFLAQTVSRILSRSKIVHADGPMSVRAAFTTDEVNELAVSAGLKLPEIQRHWPQRMLLTWSKAV